MHRIVAMAHFLNMIHKKAADRASIASEEDEELTANNIPEEKLREEDMVFITKDFWFVV